ncbi:MAG: hypothetical protein JNL32_03080 [Candidatus Kapabacteria bacterium]|nr:hypothetical protein [Candidatus Kapabacteria bacterium]
MTMTIRMNHIVSFLALCVCLLHTNLRAQITYPLNLEKLNTNLEGAYTVCMAEGKNGAVLIGTPQGCYRSIDNGATWQRANTGLSYRGAPDLDIRSMASTPSRVLFAGTPNNLYRSFDNGATWQGVGAGLQPSQGVLYLYAHNNGAVYAGIIGHVFSTIDSGATWMEVGANIPNEQRKQVGQIVFGKTKVYLSFGDYVYRSEKNGPWLLQYGLGSWGTLYADTVSGVVFIVEGKNVNSFDKIDSGDAHVSYPYPYYPVNTREKQLSIRFYHENEKKYRTSPDVNITSTFLSNVLFFSNGSYLIGASKYGIDSVNSKISYAGF